MSDQNNALAVSGRLFTTARTVVDQLDYGIEVDGKLQFEFELRLFTVEDNIQAVATATGAGMDVTRIMLARALVRLGDLPKERITPELLGGLVDDDYDLLLAVQAELKKKLKRSSASSSPSAPQS
jgi:hypothetical protein